VIADIGIPEAVIAAVEGPYLELLTRDVIRPLVEPRPADSHKGDYGHVLVVAGGRGKTGAAYLSAMGALRSGAGLVTVATAASSQPIVAVMAPEYMTEGLAETPEGAIAFEALEHILTRQVDVIACGPGLGTAPGTVALVRGLLERAGVPLVLDADALNAFASSPELLVGPEGRDVIITPHPGELARLVGVTTADVQANRIEIAQGFAETHQLYVVLKGHRTIVATPEGRIFVNPTGNPGMATGGMGDLLTGMVAAWLAQLLDAEAACKLAVYLHGLAGDLAEAEKGEVALTPTDVLAHLGAAVAELSARRKVQKDE
jgi:NAD(P)H-hydrate epimerase